MTATISKIQNAREFQVTINHSKVNASAEELRQLRERIDQLLPATTSWTQPVAGRRVDAVILDDPDPGPVGRVMLRYQYELDRNELAWWRLIFAPRFGPDCGLPKVGTPLYGRRLRIIDDGAQMTSEDRNVIAAAKRWRDAYVTAKTDRDYLNADKERVNLRHAVEALPLPF